MVGGFKVGVGVVGGCTFLVGVVAGDGDLTAAARDGTGPQALRSSSKSGSPITTRPRRGRRSGVEAVRPQTSSSFPESISLAMVNSR